MHDLYVCRTLNSSALTHAEDSDLLFMTTANIVRTLNPKKCNFNAPAIRKKFFSKFDKYYILAL